ncbi:membrane associated rhomboid family serine protease [Anaerotaenia torta]|uniref:rhomboid family intramembrane serine protease n=1 Tax=Anaerotaenia torta TaxID=433293 RepID=UPI003D1D24B2
MKKIEANKSFGIFQYNAPVTLTFVLLSFLVLMLGYLTRNASTTLLFCTYPAPLTNPLTYVRLLGHVLGHADWKHYSGNMVLFLVLGPLLEEKYGSGTLLKMFAFTALISGLIYMIFFPQNALLGASGIVFMMIVLSSVAGMQNGKIPITLILVIIIYLGREITDSLGSTDTIAHVAHVTGGLCGAVFGMLLVKKH